MHKTTPMTSLISVTALGLAGSVAQAAESFTGEAKDAWLTGRIETLYTLNEHLNPFSIDTSVNAGMVHLTGEVESEIDRDLAEELARGIDGVAEIRNDLVVTSGAATGNSQRASGNGKRRDFGTWVDDATTTAAVKTRLIGNSNTKGLQIDVDTSNDVVTLSGRVQTDEERELAEEIALNSRDVSEVRNNLVVDPS